MKHILTVLAALLLASQVTLHAGDTLLIENGQPRAEIVIAEKPARMTKLAAKELQTYLEKISGAKLEILSAPTAGKVASNSYYEIAINPAGAVLEIDHGKDGPGVKWTSGAQIAEFGPPIALTAGEKLEVEVR